MNEEVRKQKLKEFILENHEFSKDYYRCYFESLKRLDWREKLRFLFVSALSAGGQGGISQKAESIKKFENIIQKMNQPTYEELLRAFNVENYDGLFRRLRSEEFKQMGAKKSALFLRDILFFDNYKIIQDIPKGLKKEFLVPVDRVIVRTVNSIFNMKHVPGQNKTFHAINHLAKEVFPNEPILLEDLWFWGRFYRCKEPSKSKIPFCHFNSALLLVDINVTKDYRTKLINFAKEHVLCPFKEICSKNPAT